MSSLVNYNQAEIARINGMIAALSAGQPQGGPPFTPVALPAEATIPAPAPLPVPVAAYPYYSPGYYHDLHNPSYANYAAAQAAHTAAVQAAQAARAANPPVVGSTTPGGRPIVAHPVTGLPSVQTRGGRFRHVESELDAAEIDSAEDADDESDFDEAEADSALDSDDAEADSALDSDDVEDVEQAEVDDAIDADAEVDSVAVAPKSVPARSMNRYRNHRNNHHGAVKVTVNVNSPRHAFHRRAMKK